MISVQFLPETSRETKKLDNGYYATKLTAPTLTTLNDLELLVPGGNRIKFSAAFYFSFNEVKQSPASVQYKVTADIDIVDISIQQSENPDTVNLVRMLPTLRAIGLEYAFKEVIECSVIEKYYQDADAE